MNLFLVSVENCPTAYRRSRAYRGLVQQGIHFISCFRSQPSHFDCGYRELLNAIVEYICIDKRGVMLWIRIWAFVCLFAQIACGLSFIGLGVEVLALFIGLLKGSFLVRYYTCEWVKPSVMVDIACMSWIQAYTFTYTCWCCVSCSSLGVEAYGIGGSVHLWKIQWSYQGVIRQLANQSLRHTSVFLSLVNTSSWKSFPLQDMLITVAHISTHSTVPHHRC